MKSDFVFTSESVTEGHPDKLSDQISDAIVDHFLLLDRYARIVCECAVAKGVVFIAARFASEARVDISPLARQVIQQSGYTAGEFSARDCSILTSLVEMSASERIGRDESTLDDAALETVIARNQVTAFGFACNQTAALMPLPIWLARRLSRRLYKVRANQTLPYLTPDGTIQVGIEYRDRRPHRIHGITIVVSQHERDRPTPETLRADLMDNVIQPIFLDESIRPDSHSRILINPGGIRVGGGPAAHSGMTGRKTGSDTYGGYSRHSESALSGKDPLRVDRTAAYIARYTAKNVVAAGLAEECEVQISYAIGLARPVSIQLETFGTSSLEEEEILRRLTANIDFRVGSVIRNFDLRSLPSTTQDGFYRKLATYGQLGRTDIELPWESTDLAQSLSR
jgi:S-adenosylmethionine synthetase